MPITVNIRRKSSAECKLNSKRSSIVIYYNDSIIIKPKVNKSFININSVTTTTLKRVNKQHNSMQKENNFVIRTYNRPSSGKQGKIIRGSAYHSLPYRVNHVSNKQL